MRLERLGFANLKENWLDRFVMVAWEIWGARYELIFEGQRKEPAEEVRLSLIYLEAFLVTRGGAREVRGRGRQDSERQ